MAKETRQIMLNCDEMAAALGALRNAQPERIPPGRIIALRPDADGVTIDVRHRDDFGPLNGSHFLSAETVREAMIRFCLENNVPLPLRARKWVTCAGGDFVLQIHLESDMLTGVNYSSQSLAHFKGAAAQPDLRSAGARA
jgi:hypothetical protein